MFSIENIVIVKNENSMNSTNEGYKMCNTSEVLISLMWMNCIGLLQGRHLRGLGAVAPKEKEKRKKKKRKKERRELWITSNYYI